MTTSRTERLALSFWKRVSIEGECWHWAGALNNMGYGFLHTRIRPDLRLAHRLSWTLYRGEIPSGLWVLHSCDQPSCVNPNHLFLGTRQDNVDDMLKKGRNAKGEGNGASKLTDVQVREIYLMRGKISGMVLAKKYGVAFNQIYVIWRRERWRHITKHLDP